MDSSVRYFIYILLAFSAPLFLKAEPVPDELQGVGIEDHTGRSIDVNVPFQDEKGQTVLLKKYFTGQKPVLFFLVYYECPNLCTFTLNSAVDSLKRIDMRPGEQFEIVALSINPRETAQLAAEKVQAYLNLYGHPESAAGWHFLTGKEENITKVAGQVGFQYKWDPQQKQYAHASAMYVFTADGKISRTFYGIDYPPRDMKVALLEAGRGRIGNLLDKIILFCYHYDASTKKYVLLASRLMTAGGAVTVAVLTIFMAGFWRKERAHQLKGS